MRGDPRAADTTAWERMRLAIVRAGSGRLRAVCLRLQLLVGRLTVAMLRPPRGSSLYAVGSFADGDPVPGLSDLDLVVIMAGDPSAPGGQRARVRLRRRALRRRVPWLLRHVDVRLTEQAELCAATSSSPTIDPPVDPPPLALADEAERDELLQLVRPGPFGPAAGWRLLAGRPRLPSARPLRPEHRHVPVWLELETLWRHAWHLARDPRGPYAPLLASKLVSDSAIAWLWLALGECWSGRDAALRRALEVAPRHERFLQAALTARARLGRGDAPDVASGLGGLAAFSADVAKLIAERGASDGGVDVKLVGDVGEGRIPLVDWRGLAVPASLDDHAERMEGDPRDPTTLGGTLTPGADWPLLRHGDLVVLPTVEPTHPKRPFVRSRPVLRSVKCPAADPAIFALLDECRTARFTGLAGWAAVDTARRAVQEHRAWRRAGGRGRAGLLSGARAGLFAASLEAGDPWLALDERAVLEALGVEYGDERRLERAADLLLA
jgi:hypothetical protein